MTDTVEIRHRATAARLALAGAEPVSWRVGGTEYLWSGDPAHWNRHAPWLFPVVGASAGGAVTVAGTSYPMAQHGFARDSRFTVVAQAEDSVTLRLTDTPESHVISVRLPPRRHRHGDRRGADLRLRGP